MAQLAALCPGAGCAPSAQRIDAADRSLWVAAAAVHELKLQFVGALQRFTRAQAGTFGDEGTDLRESLASMHAALARWDAAILRFRADADRADPSAEIHVAVATVLLDRHRPADALRELDAADRLDDRRADVHTLRALASGLAGRSEDAARALRAAASIDPANPTTFYALARHEARLDRSDRAVDALRAFRRLLPGRGAAGSAAPGASPFERVDLLRQSADAAPIFPHGPYGDGYSALHAGDYETALARFDEAVAAEPLLAGDAPERRRVADGAGALRRGQLAAALGVLQGAVTEAPADAESHRLLGLVYWIDGQQGRGIDHLRSAIRLAPADERARVRLADVLLADGRSSEAERELRHALDAGMRSGQIHYRLAQLYRQQSLLPRAVGELEASEAFGPVVGRDFFYQQLGSMRVDQADFDGAVEAYTRRIEVNPNHGEAHRRLGEIYFIQGRHEEALAEFAAASWLDPNDARAHAAEGQVHLRMLKYAEAAEAFQQALALDPRQREARYALGTAWMRLGKAEDGARELEAFQRLQSDAEAAGQREFQLDALRREASRHLNAGAPDHAVALFEKIRGVDPDSARSFRDLGLALLRARRPQEAIGHLEIAQRMERTPEGFRYLADAYIAAGDREAGVRHQVLYRESVDQAKRERIRELAGGP